MDSHNSNIKHRSKFFIVYQILIIAYATGILWLRRNPLSLIFSAISPFSLLFVLFVISDGQYTQFALVGSLIMALVGYGLALGQDISYYKIEYKIQDMFVASSVSSLTYMIGLALSEILFGFPALVILIFLTIYFGVDIIFLPLMFSTIIIIWITTSSMGFFLSSHMMHIKNATQIISFINVFMTVLPPVFYSVEILPLELQYVAYLIPTTHASIMMQHAMGLSIPGNWSLELGLAVQIIFASCFIILAKTKSIWREP